MYVFKVSNLYLSYASEYLLLFSKKYIHFNAKVTFFNLKNKNSA